MTLNLPGWVWGVLGGVLALSLAILGALVWFPRRRSDALPIQVTDEERRVERLQRQLVDDEAKLHRALSQPDGGSQTRELVKLFGEAYR